MQGSAKIHKAEIAGIGQMQVDVTVMRTNGKRLDTGFQGISGMRATANNNPQDQQQKTQVQIHASTTILLLFVQGLRFITVPETQSTNDLYSKTLPDAQRSQPSGRHHTTPAHG